MLAGGVRLVGRGGSPYYLVAGALIGLSAYQLIRRRRRGDWLFGGGLAVTLAWANYEVGFDGWGLLPRIFALSLFGLWLLLPWTQHALAGGRPPTSRVKGAALIAGGVLVSAAIGLALHIAV